MQCYQCQQENPPQAKFCLECGTRLVLTCAPPHFPGPPAALPYPILRRLSRPRYTALRLAAGRSGGGARGARKCASEGWPPAEACGWSGGAKRAFIFPIHRSK